MDYAASPAMRQKLYIGGKWRDASDGGTFDVINPATGRLVTAVADGTVRDAAEAMDAASEAQPGWAGRLPRDRAEILQRIYKLLIDREDEFSRLITIENGKALSDARSEHRYAAEFFRWFAEEAVRNLGSLSNAPASGARTLVQHKPAGVAVLITPWNFPEAMGTRKIAPALAAGCTCVVKPATETPLTMLALADVFAEAGVPAGVVNILPSTRAAEVVSHMLHDARARVVSFTGSTEVGRLLLREAADCVVNPRMELGGNAPFIVLEDADLELAVEGALIAKMRNMGEACTAANRFYVHESLHDAFANKLAAKMGNLTVGNGLIENVSVGPLVNAKTRDKVEALVNDAVERGAKVLTGGRRGDDPNGFYYLPTVLTDVPSNAACIEDEIFGPVAAIQKFTSEEEVIKLANSTQYGLAAYVFTRDIGRGLKIGETLEFGMVGLNRGIVSDPAAPFGGVKQSGLGREGAHEGLMEFLETQYISVTW